MKDIRNTDRGKRNIREESMAAIRLLYMWESDFDQFEQVSLYLDLCQIIDQYKDINSMNSVNIWSTSYTYYTVIFVIANALYLYINNGYIHKINAIQNLDTPYLDRRIICSYVIVNFTKLGKTT